MNLAEALAAVTLNRFQAQKDGLRPIARAQRCLRFLGAERPAKRVTAADARRMVLAMRETGLSPASVNRHLSAFAAVLDAAGVKVDLPWQREPRGRTRWLSVDEVRLLVAACNLRCTRTSRLVRFLAESGMRVGEALRLTWADLELAGVRPHAIVRDSKNGDDRWVPLTAEARQAVGTEHGAGPWVGLSQSRVNHVFRAARDSVAMLAGDAEVVPHTLRHTAASRLVRAGVSLPLVQAWLGHRDYRSTLRYVHVDEAGLAAAARILEDARA